MNKQRILSNIFAVILLVFAAVFVMLGIQSTTALAAENEQPAEEVVLYSEQSVPVEQEITQEDYDKMENQYNIHPDGTPVIESKTVETETVVTKSDNKIKTTNKTTTGWVIRDTTSSTPTSSEIQITAPDQNTAATASTPDLTPALLALAIPALAIPAVAIAAPAVVAAAPVIIVSTPAVLAVAVPVIAAIAIMNNSSSNTSTGTSEATPVSGQNTQSGVGSLSGLNLLG